MSGKRGIYSGSGGGSGSNLKNVLIQDHKLPSDNHSLFVSGPSSSFLGSRSIISFEGVNGGKRSKGSFLYPFDPDLENENEDLEEYFNQQEKKRRLTVDQVEFLEKNFKLDDKLEPERKIQLAKDIGLQPRQVAIWFQNRRARWKTKQLESDYEVLKASYDTLKVDYNNGLNENEKLKAEVLQLTDKLLLKAKNGGDSEVFVNNEQLNSTLREHAVDSISEGELSEIATSTSKYEYQNTSKSDNPYSSYVLEPEKSDLSQDEEDDLSRSLLAPPSCEFSEIRDAEYTNPSPANSHCLEEYGEIEDHGLLFWSY